MLSGTPFVDLHDPEFLTDPFPTYSRLRDHAAAYYVSADDVWILTRYDDVARAARSPGIFSSRVGLAAAARRSGTGVSFRIGAPNVRLLLSLDPPEHTAFRRAVSAAFTPRAIDTRAARVASIADELLTDLVDRSLSNDADFYRDVAEPLPVRALAEMLGVPPEMHAELRSWTRVITSDLDPRTAEQQAGVGMDMLRFFRSAVRERRRAKRDSDDVISVLARATEFGLSDYEVTAFCAFLLFAGIETTTNLLTNLVAVLTSEPDVQRELRSNPDFVGGALEEALRFDAPVQGMWRGTTEAVKVGDTVIPAGARVLLAFGSAGRDDRHYENANRFVLRRGATDHLAFSAGPHYCLGASLGRLEAAEAVRALLRRTAWIDATDSERTTTLVLHGFVAQGVCVTPR